jgi:glutamate-1-semialdehyde 2,1-aminomutase
MAPGRCARGRDDAAERSPALDYALGSPAMTTQRSQSIFERARAIIPGGVNSPVRACRSVGADPVFIARGEGGRIVDADGNEYIDLIGSWGPLILGHCHREILDVIRDTMVLGTTFGAPTEIEVKFAETLRAAVPSMEMVRAVSSGTEATMSALRLARGFTGRAKIIKADGGYHGHADCLLVAAGSGAATLGIPGSAGVPEGAARDTIVVPFNDLASVERHLAGGDVAAIIIEPVAGNMGLVAPAAGYLEGLRALTQRHGTVLIFDEVMTGFRVAYGGAQARYQVTPDLTTIGKIIGGGLPAAAFGGRADIMQKLAPLGPVYQAGTLSGNPLAMAAGIKAMEILARPGTYERLEQLGKRLGDGLLAAAQGAKVPAVMNRVGSMLTLFFTAGPVTDYASAKAADTARFGSFFRGMRDRGVFLPPSQYEAMFVSLAHTEEDVDRIVGAAREALAD